MAIGGLIGSLFADNSGTDAAAKASVEAAQIAANETRAARDKAYSTLDPFIKGGTAAGSSINALLGLGGNVAQQRKAFDTFRNSTGYQFRLGEGMNALNSGYAGAGTIQSGDAMRKAMEYGQNFASNEFGNYLSALGNQQGVGVQAGGAAAGVGINSANSLSQIYMNRGDNLANAALTKQANNNNALNGILSGLAGIFGSNG